MFLSFVVPVYNTEKYIAECLDSLLNQNISKDDYEIICVNDGSTDRSNQILEEYSDKYSNIKVIGIQNSGVSAARNIGIEAALGDYIWMVDSDDFIARNILAELQNEACTNNSDIIDFGAYTFNEKLSKVETIKYLNNELQPNSFANHVYITRGLLKREFLHQNRIKFDENIAYSEDSLFKCECLLLSPTVLRLNKVCYFFRFHAGSATTLSSTEAAVEKKLYSWLNATVKFKKYYFDCDSSSSEMKKILADLLMGNLWAQLSLISKLPKSEATQHIKSLRKNKLFPFTRLKECTLKKSYQMSGNGIIVKIYDKLYINLHTVSGYHLMRLCNIVRAILK